MAWNLRPLSPAEQKQHDDLKSAMDTANAGYKAAQKVYDEAGDAYLKFCEEREAPKFSPVEFEVALAEYLAGLPEIERPAREFVMRPKAAQITQAMQTASASRIRDGFPVVTIGGRICTLQAANLPLSWPLMVVQDGAFAPIFLDVEHVFVILGDWKTANQKALDAKPSKRPRK
jgi:hypothetical protein